MDLLKYVDSKTVIVKLDAEGFECKVDYRFNQYYVAHHFWVILGEKIF